ncbi:MAG: ATP-binding cassette domain-containing protein, partial [Anaerolineales bacterium]
MATTARQSRRIEGGGSLSSSGIDYFGFAIIPACQRIQEEPMQAPVIEINGLVKRYAERVAVDGVSFAVREAEIFGLLGPNGAGKTTTLSMLSTLLAPDQGRATIGGYDLAREPGRIKPLIGFVPQELALFPTLSAWDNLAFFGRIYRLSGPALKGRIRAVLELVG